jgi:hypothetical protein
LSATKRTAAEHRIAEQVHKQIRIGNITLAARGLEEGEAAAPAPETSEKLRKLHPEADPPPDTNIPETIPVQVRR